MGLDYLMKKVWHPGSMKNIEKVWQAEEKQRQIDRKHLEMKKKLQEQRHNEDLKRMQVEAGLIPRSHLDRMDWMYDWGNKVQNPDKNAEEYLMGKPADMKKNGKEIRQVFKEQITNAKCQDFALTHEDPMYAIMKEEKLRRQTIQENPIKMKAIRESIEGFTMPKKKNKSRSKSQQKKHKKHKKRKDSRSPSTSRSNSRSRSRERQRRPKQSEEYKQYLKQHLGPILKQEDGYLKPDFSKYRKKYKTDYQLNQQQRREQLRQMEQNGRRMYEERMYREEEKPETQNTGDHFLDIRRKQMKQYDLSDNLKRDSRKYQKED